MALLFPRLVLGVTGGTCCLCPFEALSWQVGRAEGQRTQISAPAAAGVYLISKSHPSSLPSASWPSALPPAFAATGLWLSNRRLLGTWVRKRRIKYVSGDDGDGDGCGHWPVNHNSLCCPLNHLYFRKRACRWEWGSVGSSA